MSSPHQTDPTPTVSVVIPLYNKRQFVLRALKSVIAQSWQDWEIIIVDDGSTDGGHELVATQTDPRIHLIRQTNAGPGTARNRGIRESRGRMIAFLDADDEWLPDFLERGVGILEAHPGCGAFWGSRLQGTDRRPREEVYHRPPVAIGPWRMPTDLPTRQILSSVSFLFFSGSFLTRREVFQKIGGFYEHHCTCGEDNCLWLNVAFHYLIYRHPQAVVWWHSEDSELSNERHGVPAEPAYLQDPDEMRRQCPPEYRDLLERFLTDLALHRAKALAWHGRPEQAVVLIDRFPLMRQWTMRYVNLRLHLLLAPGMHWLRSKPALFRLVRRLRGQPDIGIE